jgi:hypothetical protein
MRRRTAAVGSALFFLLAPGVVVGLIPWLLTRWQVREPLPYWAPMRVIGGILLVAGLIVLVGAFVRFVVEGFGTPAPVAAPERLVVGGVYRHVGNPMYVAVLAATSRRSCASTRNPPSPGASARTTRPTGVRYPPGGLACIPGSPEGMTNEAQGDALADNSHSMLAFPQVSFR